MTQNLEQEILKRQICVEMESSKTENSAIQLEMIQPAVTPKLVNSKRELFASKYLHVNTESETADSHKSI